MNGRLKCWNCGQHGHTSKDCSMRTVNGLEEVTDEEGQGWTEMDCDWTGTLWEDDWYDDWSWTGLELDGLW